MPSPESTPPAVRDAVARQLVGALLAGLALLLPVRGALGSATTGRLLLWLLGAVLLAVLVGRLLEEIDVPRPFATSLVTAGTFAVLVLGGLTLLSLLGDPGSDNEVTLIVGVPAAALAAVVAVVVLGRRDDDALAVGVVAGGLFVALAFSNAVGGLVLESRTEAEDQRVFEQAGLTAYVPDLGDLDAVFSGTYYSRPPEGGARFVTGYDLDYLAESDEESWDTAAVRLSVRLSSDAPDCEELEGRTTCEEGDGYVVRRTDDSPPEVVVDRGDMRLVATFRDGDGDLPSTDEVGRALVEAEIAEWSEVVSLEG